jgi:glycosyltransferase involved in cell wall biosynthesis
VINAKERLNSKAEGKCAVDPPSVSGPPLGRPRICFVVSAPETASSFLSAHIRALSSHYEVTLIANFPAGQEQLSSAARQLSVPIERKVRPLKDLAAWFTLYRALRAGHFQSVHSVTPKAGLLAMTAAWAARVPNRFHWFTGQVWVTRRGVSRTILKAADRIIAKLTTVNLVDSATQRDFLVEQGLITTRNSAVLGSGSICGVDTERFIPNPEVRKQIRAFLGIKDESVVILFVGRLTRDKGLLELCSAFASLRANPSTHLVVVGPDEEGLIQILGKIMGESEARFSFVGSTDRPEDFMAASDILCLPSHREGFGISVIEAASCAVPCVASDIYGLRDAVADGSTGLLFPVSDVKNLSGKLQMLIDDVQGRIQMGVTARQRTVKDFDQNILTAELQKFYATHVVH